MLFIIGRPGSRGSVNGSVRGNSNMSVTAGEVNSTLTKGAGWPWEGTRRVPVEKSVENSDQQALSVDRFGHVGSTTDAYVSVRTTSDLANAANYSSAEQRELEQFIHDGKREGSPPWTADTADGTQPLEGPGFGDWPGTWQEVQLEPLGQNDQFVERAMTQVRQPCSLLLLAACRLLLAPCSLPLALAPAGR